MKKVILLTVLLCGCTIVRAQDEPGDNPDIQAPIDGGVVAMAAAGAIYAVKKLRNVKENKQEEPKL